MSTHMETGQSTTPPHRHIELLAYKLWVDRGAPFGTPDVDWFRAEDELKRTAAESDLPLTMIAKKIGRTLGSIEALAANTLSGNSK